MLTVNNVSLKFGGRTLFNEVSLKFEPGNCYGLIGANGAGKTTFLKVLSGEIDSTTGDVTIGKNERLSVLRQNHHLYDDYQVLETVIMGNEKLTKIMKEKDEIYSKADFNEKDGIRAGELESAFSDMNGWEAESDAAILLAGLGIQNELHTKMLKDLKGSEKVKVLLAQALFGNPDILFLDEPTNHLDVHAKMWLEDFLIDFENTVIVVSHDRHFLNKVCTHIVDIDYERIKMFVGNYDFWYESNELIQQQMKDSNAKKEEKIKQLQDFIARFSANASKSKQATSRKKSLEKIILDDIVPSTRKYPFINFKFERPLGKDVLEIKKISKSIDGKKVIDNFSLSLSATDKIAIIGDEIAITTFFKILNDEILPDTGDIIWGSTVIKSYFPKNYNEYFKEDISLTKWLQGYSNNLELPYIRGFLGRMLFSGDEALKSVQVLSGGEKARCMFSKMMLSNANLLMFDDPTNHLDIESITSLNKELINYKSCVLFSSHDHELLNSVANRIIEFKSDGTFFDKYITYDEYLNINK